MPPEEPMTKLELQEQLQACRARKSAALQRLKRTAERVATGTPADSKTFRLYQKEDEPLAAAAPAAAAPDDDPAASGTRIAIPDQAERVEHRQAQVAKVREARKNGVAALKKATSAAVQTFRETRLFDSDDLNERLAEIKAAPRPNGA
jgi:hypothetical protein